MRERPVKPAGFGIKRPERKNVTSIRVAGTTFEQLPVAKILSANSSCLYVMIFSTIVTPASREGSEHCNHCRLPP